MRYKCSFLIKFSLLLLVLTAVLAVSPKAQNTSQTSLEWLAGVKTPRNTRTLALWRAGADGFQLLRLRQEAEAPAVPLLTLLGPDGRLKGEAPLPGFEPENEWVFRLAVASDSLALIGYEAALPGGGFGLFARRFNLLTGAWTSPAQLVASAPSANRPAFANAWFRRSADGESSCLYHLPAGPPRPQADLAVFDRRFDLRWQRTLSLPPQKGAVAVRDLLCTAGGAVVLEAQVAEGSIPAFAPAPPAAYWPDGPALYDPQNAWREMPPHHNVLFLVAGPTEEVASFYPATGGKFTPALSLTEHDGRQVYCSGFYSGLDNRRVEGYFVYAIDLTTRQASLLQKAPFPSSVRKALLSERAAQDKEPLPGLALRWMKWAADGKAWMLAERETFAPDPAGLQEALLFRLDSTFRINSVRKIEKSQQPGARRDHLFNSLAAYAGEKSGWWLCRNEGNYPHNRFVLTECRAGEPKEYELAHGPALDVAFLPNTLLRQDKRWYFVGESEAGEKLRIGYLERVR
jgi:hypothetical protein